MICGDHLKSPEIHNKDVSVLASAKATNVTKGLLGIDLLEPVCDLNEKSPTGKSFAEV